MDLKNIFKHKLNIAIMLMVSTVLFTACPNPPTPDPDSPIQETGYKGMYVLNEGNWNGNNSSITYYDFETGSVTADIFTKVNHRGLGDVGNDLKRYGSKLYCVVNVSETVEIMNANTCSSIKQIFLSGKQPRKIAFYGSKAYVSCSDGDVVRIDTVSLAVEASVMSGLNPEDLCVISGKLYVANSGQFNYPEFNNTISVIDCSSFSVIKTIEVHKNPLLFGMGENQILWLLSSGDYSAEFPSKLQQINTQQDVVLGASFSPVAGFYPYHQKLYYFNSNYVTGATDIKVMNPALNDFPGQNVIADHTAITLPYAIYVDGAVGVIICDALNYTSNGDVYGFDFNGKKIFKFEAGVCPKSVVLLEN
ncbi:MAG: hypothetical protein LBU51_06175 [Bacteroidales bacterium]|jgi:YVTN family beta-propeller protein|nr:hypothetical protein [Bacteroidales bacterium]